MKNTNINDDSYLSLLDAKYGYLNLNDLPLEDEDIKYRGLRKESLGFRTGAVKTAIEFYKRTFNLPNKEQFEKKFLEAISGDGDELSKIDALHSSSLCALLCFYNLKGQSLKIAGMIFKCEDVYFEVKNRVTDKGRPSNMDVVLIGQDENGKRVILFIECKLSEYLGSSSKKLSETYRKDPYNEVFKQAGFYDAKVFAQGIKQIVCHFFGLQNFIKEMGKESGYMKSEYSEKDHRAKLYEFKYDSIYFLEVIFEIPGAKFTKYKEEAEEAIKGLKGLVTDERLKLCEPTTYQKLFKKDNPSALPGLVKSFYKLG